MKNIASNIAGKLVKIGTDVGDSTFTLFLHINYSLTSIRKLDTTTVFPVRNFIERVLR
uniref:Uncharacterized protein n=1 Tax=viral metagenome TaxID=1070528 RepID=A0A6M3X572_9ZZZZ